MGATVRAIRESDHEKVTSLVDEWWGGRHMAWLLPRLFFWHFEDTSFAVEEDGELIAFLSQSREGKRRADRRCQGWRSCRHSTC